MIVSSDQDPANVDNLTGAETMPEWRLVPNDNNIGQRNVNVMAAAKPAILTDAFKGISFWVGNPNLATAKMRLEVRMPKVLSQRGWKLAFDIPEGTFPLRPGRQKEVGLILQPGDDFDQDDIDASRNHDIVVLAFADENPVGGVTYRLDPTAHGTEINAVLETSTGTEPLLRALKLGSGNVKNIRVRRVNLDIEFGE